MELVTSDRALNAKLRNLEFILEAVECDEKFQHRGVVINPVVKLGCWFNIEKAGGREIKGRLGAGQVASLSWIRQDGGRQSINREWIRALEST